MNNWIANLLLTFTLLAPSFNFALPPFTTLSRDYPEIYFPNGTHSVIALSAYGDTVELEDGSQFNISPNDAHEIAKWRASDPILVTQNHAWFSKYNYRLINQATGVIIQANVCTGPDKNGHYTKRITSIDAYLGVITLNDGTRWQISSYDMNHFNAWEEGDAVILGYNTGGDEEYLGILINVPMQQQSIRVGQI